MATAFRISVIVVNVFNVVILFIYRAFCHFTVKRLVDGRSTVIATVSVKTGFMAQIASERIRPVQMRLQRVSVCLEFVICSFATYFSGSKIVVPGF